MIVPFARAALVFFLVSAVLALPVIAIAPLAEVRMFGVIAALAAIAGFTLNAVALGPEWQPTVASMRAHTGGSLRDARAWLGSAWRRLRAPAAGAPAPAA